VVAGFEFEARGFFVGVVGTGFDVELVVVVLVVVVVAVEAVEAETVDLVDDGFVAVVVVEGVAADAVVALGVVDDDGGGCVTRGESKTTVLNVFGCACSSVPRSWLPKDSELYAAKPRVNLPVVSEKSPTQTPTDDTSLYVGARPLKANRNVPFAARVQKRTNKNYRDLRARKHTCPTYGDFLVLANHVIQLYFDVWKRLLQVERRPIGCFPRKTKSTRRMFGVVLSAELNDEMRLLFQQI
jgi:hypothetical protein